MKYIFGAFAAASAAAVFAQTAGQQAAGKDVTAQPAARADVVGQGAIDFADPGNATAKALAAELGISVGEATSRLRSQARLARVISDLERRSPDSFAGVKVIQRGQFRIRALFKGNSDRTQELASLSTTSAIGQPIEQGTAVLAKADEKAFADRFTGKVRGSNKRAVFTVDEESGEVVIGGADDPALRQAAEEAAEGLPIKVRFDPGLTIIETDYAIAGQAFNGDGTSTEDNVCTTGFSVVSGGIYGTSTAAHCQNTPAEFNAYMNTSYGTGRRLAFRQEWKSGTDVQWHTPSVAGDQPGPYYWNGTQSIAIASTYQTAVPSGYGLCKFGRVTGWDCGTTGAAVRDTNYGNGLFYSVTSSTADMSIEGDSGGPVATGQTAYGWIHGRAASARTMYYTPIVEVYRLTPLRLTVCVQPC